MQKRILLRILFFTLLYTGIFILLVSVQFSGSGGFTVMVGDFVVWGQHRQPGENESLRYEYYLDGNVQVIFGGMGFEMAKGGGGRSLYFVDSDGARVEALPASMIISENSAQFLFPGGTELVFASHYVRGLPEIRIAAVFAEDVSGIELPFTPQRRTRLMDSGNGQLIAVSGGVYHSFGNSPMDLERRVLHVNLGGRPVSYRAIPDRRVFSPYNYILTQAETVEAYNEFITQWRGNNFSRWGQAVLNQNNEDIVLAHVSEAFTRGTYRTAVSAVPASFMAGAARTHHSSVYLGGLDRAHVSLIAEERETLSLLSRQINEGSHQFLTKPMVFDYLAVRGQNSLIETASNIVRTMDPGTLYIDIVPGILEGHTSWMTFRPGTANPFEPLLDQTFFIISDSLRMISNSPGGPESLSHLVLVDYDGQGEAEFNLRLGKALVAHAERAQIEAWTKVGRSMVLSALSAGDASGPELSARLYNILKPGIHPRAVSVGTGIWAWTASSDVSAVQQNDILDISVRFPAGESHYMIIRGIRPFVRLQLYNMDWRSDPQFERFDSSGWRYIPQEQTLLVKMRHRSNIENIRIIFWEPPPPPPPAPPPVVQVDVDYDELDTAVAS